MSSLFERARLAISSSSERWYSGLAGDLADAGWANLRKVGIGPEVYGTSRIIRCDASAARGGYELEASGWGRRLWIEPLEDEMLARYGALGISAPQDFDRTRLASDLANAMSLIDAAPGAADAVRALVWSLIPVGTEGPDYDTSYSDPAAPFSIFVGLHRAADKVPVIRLAESILHEAMHLQLSLLEDVLPLIRGGSHERPSPWQRRLRPTQGLLHGLYVFRVVQDWLRAAVASNAFSIADAAHASSRVKQIDQECAELRGMDLSPDLTAEGRMLAEALLR